MTKTGADRLARVGSREENRVGTGAGPGEDTGKVEGMQTQFV